jgi:monoamine oxidase
MVTRRDMTASLAAILAGSFLPIGLMPRVLAAEPGDQSGGRPTEGQSDEVDVLIVGAGVAGIAAAHTLRQSGLTVLVLEARDRIGGRTWTDTSKLGVPVDVGGQWLHNGASNPFVAIAKQLGFDLNVSDREDGWLFRDGVRTPRRQVDAYSAASEALMKRAEAALRGGKDLSLADLGRGDRWLELAAAQIGAADSAQDAELISVHDLVLMSGLEELDHDVVGGLGAMVARWGQDVPVALGKAVTQIDWSGAGVRASGNFGTVRARAAIITVPTSLLAADRIVFSPALPVETQESFAHLPLGLMQKVSLKLNRMPQGMPPYAVNMGAIDAGLYHGVHFDQVLPVATVMFGGTQAWTLEREGEAAAVAAATGVLAGVMGTSVSSQIVGSQVSGWGSDPWSMGSYSSAKVGYANARDVYSRPVGERLWFAGEASPGPQSVTVGGAQIAGNEAARQIAEKLKQQKGTSL